MADLTVGKYNIEYLGFGQSMVNNGSHKPIVGNEVFSTYATMMNFVQNDGTCCIGTLLKVTDDTTASKNGVYLVKSYGASGKVEKLGSDTLANYQSITYPTEFTTSQKVTSSDTLSSAFKKVETTISGLTQAVLEDELVMSRALNIFNSSVGLNKVGEYEPRATSLVGIGDMSSAIDKLANEIENIKIRLN